MNYYTFTFYDKFGADTEQRIYLFDNIKEARQHARKLLANAMDDTKKIIVKLIPNI